jgi:hypothetical protein
MDSVFNNAIDEISPRTLSELYHLTKRYLGTMLLKLENYSKSVWQQISQTALSDDVIRDFKNKVDWNWVSGNYPLYEDFIREFEEFIDWEEVSKYQNLSEGFIRDYKDKVDWKWISRYQSLSEEFIREFQDKVG